jgi:hypothetical protein
MWSPWIIKKNTTTRSMSIHYRLCGFMSKNKHAYPAMPCNCIMDLCIASRISLAQVNNFITVYFSRLEAWSLITKILLRVLYYWVYSSNPFKNYTLKFRNTHDLLGKVYRVQHCTWLNLVIKHNWIIVSDYIPLHVAYIKLKDLPTW